MDVITCYRSHGDDRLCDRMTEWIIRSRAAAFNNKKIVRGATQTAAASRRHFVPEHVADKRPGARNLAARGKYPPTATGTKRE